MSEALKLKADTVATQPEPQIETLNFKLEQQVQLARRFLVYFQNNVMRQSRDELAAIGLSVLKRIDEIDGEGEGIEQRPTDLN